jgi:hypothetical protein
MNYLSTPQIRELCIAARLAYDAWEGRAEWELHREPMSRTQCFDAWRHQETARVTGGEASLRRCVSERHYLRLHAHFADLAGEGASALRALLRHEEEGRIVVYFKLRQVLAERGLEEGYAAHIARCKYKCALGDCTEKQLWALFFDVRKRPLAATPSPAPRRIENRLGTLAPKVTKSSPARPVAVATHEPAPAGWDGEF